MNTRLKQFLSAENISQSEFAETMNIVRASVSHILSGRNKPGYEFIRSLMQNYPNLNIEWLVLGQGKMYRIAEQIQQPKSPAPPADELLFPVEDDEISLPDEEVAAPKEISNEINTLGNVTQSINNQRKITKIVVLFDDGSYQEIL